MHITEIKIDQPGKVICQKCSLKMQCLFLIMKKWSSVSLICLVLISIIIAERKPILTPCWNCFFDLLFVAFVIIIIQYGLPQRILYLCLTVKLKSLCSGPCPPVDGRKEEINFPCLRLALLRDVFKINGLFTLLPHLPSCLIYKRTWHPDPNKMVILRH